MRTKPETLEHRRKLTIAEYHADAKRVSELPTTWTGTLKSYRDARKLAPVAPGIWPTAWPTIVSADDLKKIERRWRGCNDFYPTIISADDLEKMRRYYGMRLSRPRYSADVEVTYLSQSRWGAYNPSAALVIIATRNIRGFDGATIKTIVHSEYLGNSSKHRPWDSKLWETIRTKYRDIELETGFIPWKGRKLAIQKTLYIGKTSYHCGNFPLRKCYRDLQHKLECTRRNCRNRRKANLQKIMANGHCITVARLVDEYGWCPDGINDFCESCGLSGKVRSRDVLTAWRECATDIKSRLKRNYAEEIATILRVCRADIAK